MTIVCTELKQTVLNSWYVKAMSVCWEGNGHSPPWKLGLRTKIFRKLDVKSSNTINWFISCNDTLYLAVWHSHRARARYIVLDHAVV